jgi:hypothetical protein
MSLTRTSGGLLVPEGALEAAVSRQLRELDPDLRLVPQDSDAYGQRIYKVYKFMGPDRPAAFILMWGDWNGNPFPLSSALVEEVKRHDRNLRGHESLPDADEHNRRLKSEARRRGAEELAELGRTYDRYTSGKRSFGVRIPREVP